MFLGVIQSYYFFIPNVSFYTNTHIESLCSISSNANRWVLAITAAVSAVIARTQRFALKLLL